MNSKNIYNTNNLAKSIKISYKYIFKTKYFYSYIDYALNALFYNRLKNLKKSKYSYLKEEEWYGKFYAGKASIPHYKKRAKGGEDASYQSHNLLVIADGVGGWNELGIDPAAYSKSLCEIIAYNFKKYELECEKNGKPVVINFSMIKQLLVKSTKQNKELGSSTVSVLILDNKKNELYSGYLGDSCYLIARPKGIGNFELFFKSEEQTHGFNIPFQVGSEGDNPNTAITLSHKLKRYDLILAATDGLWDNMEADDILKEINYLSAKSNSLKIDTDYLSKIISQRAEELSRDTNHYSPFARKAIENKYRNFIGGKPDDITVIVAQVYNEDKNKESILFSRDSQSEDKNKESILSVSESQSEDKNKGSILSDSDSQSTAETSCEDNISASDYKIFF